MDAETTFRTRGGARLAATAAGEGDAAVVLVHGYPFDRRMWEPQIRALSPRARVLAVDLRGFGESESGDLPASMGTFADDVIAWMDGLDARRTLLAGLSMGGYVAFEIWRRAPSKIHALALLDTKPDADSPEARKGRVKQRETIGEAGMSAVVSGMLNAVLGATTRETRPEVVALVRRMILETPPRGAMDALDAMRARPDSTGDLAGIRVPVSVIVGAEDTITPPHLSEEMAARIPGARLLVLPKAGHVTALEAPELVNRTLIELVDALSE